MSRFLLLIIMYLPHLLLGQNYLWPTNSSSLMSSSFCEFRDGHYHSAIDIKTWLREGYPCYAIADGQIERVRVSTFGYGKVIYIRLDDGNSAVYAHLQRFTTEIDQKIRDMQLKNQKYRIDWYPRNMKVKKGDIIAYTGKTGTGLPHLHFEIRNKKNHPVNPQAFYPQIKDKLRPRLKNISLIPISPDARINGNAMPRMFDLKYIKDGLYVIRRPLLVKGRIGLAINGFDQADGASNKYGFYKTRLEIDGEPAFQITYDELDFATTKHIYTETYYPFWIDSAQVFHKLYVEPFNPLPFYKNYKNHNGTLRLKDKPKQFSIIVSDFKGNTSIIRGELVPDFRTQIDVLHHKYKGSNVILDIRSSIPKDLRFFYGRDIGLLNPVDYYEFLDGNPEKDATLIRTKLSLPDSLQTFLQISLKSRQNQVSNTIRGLSEGSDSIRAIYFSGKRLIFESTALYEPPKMYVSGLSSAVDFEDLGDGRAHAVLTSDQVSDNPLNIDILHGFDTLWSNPQDIYQVFPSNFSKMSWFDSALTITIAPGTLLDTAFISTRIESRDSLAQILPLSSPVYHILPRTIPFYQRFKLELQVDSLPAMFNWQLYKTNGTSSLSFISSELNKRSNTFTSEVGSLGKFVVAADTVIPVLDIHSPLSGKLYKKNPRIRLSIDDTISGIDSEEDISILIDGQFVLPEWDHEEKTVTAIIDQPLPEGSHTLTVTVADRAGNISRGAVMFQISP